MGKQSYPEGFYVLRGKDLVPEPNNQAWDAWFGDNIFAPTLPRRLAWDKVNGADVITLCSGVVTKDSPYPFHTEVVGGALDAEIVFTSTYDDAIHNHAAMIERVKSGRKIKKGEPL